jgi:phosphoesterase RecJ-like protein
MQTEFKRFQEIIGTKQTFVLTTHINPDGDAIGSETALARFLADKGKTVHILNESETPENLRFLTEIFPVLQYQSDLHSSTLHEAECCIVIDTNSRNRFPLLQDAFDRNRGVKIIIDHHLDPEQFASLNIIDTSVPATCQLLYSLLNSIDSSSITAPVALALYTGIMTDTQSFRLPLTDPETHTIAAELLRKGVKPQEVYQHVYESGAHDTLRLLGMALNSISLHQDGKVAVMTIPRKVFIDTGTKESDVDNLTQYVLSIRGVKIGIVITELEEGIKISFRSKGDIPINKVANHFGGGGHRNAAGARITNSTIPAVTRDVLDQITRYL